MKKPVVVVMGVEEVNGHQAVHVTIALKEPTDPHSFEYLGSISCNFEQYGLLHSILKRIPGELIDYRPQLWTKYIDKIMNELASLG